MKALAFAVVSLAVSVVLANSPAVKTTTTKTAAPAMKESTTTTTTETAAPAMKETTTTTAKTEDKCAGKMGKELEACKADHTKKMKH